jgi:uncharacterized protein with GYD domain
MGRFEKEESMPKYVSLIGWTDQGVKNFKETKKRGEDAAALAAKMGGKFTAYWTIGAYDLVTISEFPDDETATAFLLRVASLGNVRTQTMRAFDAQEMSNIINKAS